MIILVDNKHPPESPDSQDPLVDKNEQKHEFPVDTEHLMEGNNQEIHKNVKKDAREKNRLHSLLHFDVHCESIKRNICSLV